MSQPIGRGKDVQGMSEQSRRYAEDDKSIEFKGAFKEGAKVLALERDN